ncbi:hypothetical protein ACFL10_02015 [Patescibacteria group bacterium]
MKFFYSKKFLHPLMDVGVVLAIVYFVIQAGLVIFSLTKVSKLDILSSGANTFYEKIIFSVSGLISAFIYALVVVVILAAAKKYLK